MATWKLNIKNYFKKLDNIHWQNAPQSRISHQTWPVILQKSFCGAFSLPATSQWPVKARINMPHFVRLSLSSSEVRLLFMTGHVW